jgi:hypothetical protein
MTAPQTYVVQAGIWVTWDREQYFVAPRTLIAVVPNSALYLAYGGANGNLQALAPATQGEDADHAELGD